MLMHEQSFLSLWLINLEAAWSHLCEACGALFAWTREPCLLFFGVQKPTCHGDDIVSYRTFSVFVIRRIPIDD